MFGVDLMELLWISTFPRTISHVLVGPEMAEVKFALTSKTSKPCPIFSREFPSRPAFSNMLRLILAEKKVFDSIVGRVMIFMMDNFRFAEKSFEVLLHDESVFPDIAFIISRRMAWFLNQNISEFLGYPTTLPSTIFFKRTACFFNVFRSMFFPFILMASIKNILGQFFTSTFAFFHGTNYIIITEAV